MTLDKAAELLKVRTDFGGFHDTSSAKLILAEGRPHTWSSGRGSADP